jgi:Uncharacterized protein conserved in bacteria (DUF2255)
MARTGDDLLWKLAESDEIQIDTQRDAKSPVHRTTIWIVPTKDGVYIRSYKGRKGRWYQEAVANPQVTIRVGPVGHRLHPDRPPVAQHQQVRRGGLRALPVQITEQLAPEVAADRHPAELRALPLATFQERRLAVVLDVLDDQRAQLTHAHARAEEDKDG